jgi:hypothetical protein
MGEHTKPGIRLNMGCSDNVFPGWYNLDIKRKVNAHHMDARDAYFYFKDVDEIYASHILEHFHMWEAIQTLDRWIGMLKVGGRIEIRVPDMRYAAERIMDGDMMIRGKKCEDARYLNPIISMVWGGDEETAHKCGFTKKSLEGLLSLFPLTFTVEEVVCDKEGIGELIAKGVKCIRKE